MADNVEHDGPAPAELGPLEKPYTYLPPYADVEYVDGKLSVARGIISRTEDPDVRRRWMQTVDILLAQRTALATVTSSASRHEFTEDVGDGSMCVCGVPALTHDSVYPPGEAGS